MNNAIFLLLGCLFSLGAVVALIAAAVVFVQGGRKQAKRTVVDGKVTAVNLRSTTPGNAGVYCPTVQFTTAEGDSYSFESEFGTRPASHKVGQIVKVGYDPLDPEQAEIVSTLTRYLGPVILAFFGLIGLCLGVMFLFFGILMPALANAQ